MLYLTSIGSNIPLDKPHNLILTYNDFGIETNFVKEFIRILNVVYFVNYNVYPNEFRLFHLFHKEFCLPKII